jgi:hypothetical protein
MVQNKITGWTIKPSDYVSGPDQHIIAIVCISLLNVSKCDIHFSKIQKRYYPSISKVNLMIVFATSLKNHFLFVWWCLTPLSTIVQLYRGGQFYWSRKQEEPEKKHQKLLINIITTRNLRCQPISHNPDGKMSTGISLSGYPNINEHLTMRLPTCKRTARYPSIKMSANITLSCYQDVNEHLTSSEYFILISR